MKNKVVNLIIFILIPLLLVLNLIFSTKFSLLLSFVIIFLGIIPFFVNLEKSQPKSRDIVPIIVMSGISSVSRIAFMAIPNVTPSTAIIIVTGISFGSNVGFLTGAISGLASNMIMGQGPWTIWQMFAWGVIGFISGKLGEIDFCKQHKITIYIFGFLGSFLFGWFMNLYHFIGFVEPKNFQTFIVSYIASFWFDINHAISTTIFLIPTLIPWGKKLKRFKNKFGIKY